MATCVYDVAVLWASPAKHVSWWVKQRLSVLAWQTLLAWVAWGEPVAQAQARARIERVSRAQVALAALAARVRAWVEQARVARASLAPARP